MYFIRYTFIKLSEIPEDLSVLNATYDGIKLETGNIGEFNRVNSIILLSASIKFKNSPVSADHILIMPNDLRRKCEETIERVTRIYAMCYGIRREIRTPVGVCVGFMAENQEEIDLLKATKADIGNESKIIFKGTPPLTEFDWETAFSDREEGVLLMSEAINQTSYSGQFRDFIRLFENAFGKPTKEIRNKLCQCLNPEFGYTNQEIQFWISLRDSLSHADKKGSNPILYEADVAPVIWRARQAAYDILLNKKDWNSRSSVRREIWRAGCYSTDSSDAFTMRSGAKRNGYIVTDPFNVYPLMLGVTVNNLPDNIFLFVNKDDNPKTE